MAVVDDDAVAVVVAVYAVAIVCTRVCVALAIIVVCKSLCFEGSVCNRCFTFKLMSCVQGVYAWQSY